MENNIFNQIAVEKLDQFEKIIKSGERAQIEMNEKINTWNKKIEMEKALIDSIESLKAIVTTWNSNLERTEAMFKSLEILVQKIDNHADLMRHPPKRKDIKVYHFHWTMGVIIGAVVLLGIAFGSNYLKSQKLHEFEANDTKYRYLQLNGSVSLHQYLRTVDSIYDADPEFRSQVHKAEKNQQERLELLQEANEKEKKAKALRQQTRSN